MSTRSERFEMRLEPQLLEKVDFWRGSQADFPSRAEAIRRLMERALSAEGESAQFQPSKGERLMLWMLAEVMKATVKNGEASAQLVLDTLDGGHFWALDWELVGVMHDSVDRPSEVREVVDILEMWRAIEWAYPKFDAAGRRRIAERLGEPRSTPAFTGFDGNHETNYMGIARFLVEKLNRFTEFSGRDFNAHRPMLGAYRRMWSRYETIKPSLNGRNLTVDELLVILKAEDGD